jgi:hypothetical protein
MVPTLAACGHAASALQYPSAGSVTVQDAVYICGRVAGTGQKRSIDAAGQTRTATAAFITAGVGAAGTLATTIVGIKGDKDTTAVMGASTILATGIAAALSTFLTTKTDTKAEGQEVDAIEKRAGDLNTALMKACANPADLGCSVKAAEAKGECDALATSLPFVP